MQGYVALQGQCEIEPSDLDHRLNKNDQLAGPQSPITTSPLEAKEGCDGYMC